MPVRDATEGDIETTTAIYNVAVANSTAIWNEVTC
jgi:L-amino acid N-acyltransferase YncA